MRAVPICTLWLELVLLFLGNLWCHHHAASEGICPSTLCSLSENKMECGLTCICRPYQAGTKDPKREFALRWTKPVITKTSLIAKWFFNVTSQTCDEFKYLGCGGNANRFPSEDFCLDLCKSETKRDDGITEADKASCREHTGDIIEPHPEAACNQRLDRGGSCPGNQPRVYWYYDQETKNCSRFLHCGCGGNDNKFPNEEFCLQCNPENGEYIYEDVSRDR
uniref:Putative tick kunitz 87 n=1 Tax=Amblyomma triste TaxID=251400 RepID=A0A023G5L9_AMBTT